MSTLDIQVVQITHIFGIEAMYLVPYNSFIQMVFVHIGCKVNICIHFIILFKTLDKKKLLPICKPLYTYFSKPILKWFDSHYYSGFWVWFKVMDGYSSS